LKCGCRRAGEEKKTLRRGKDTKNTRGRGLFRGGGDTPRVRVADTSKRLGEKKGATASEVKSRAGNHGKLSPDFDENGGYPRTSVEK